MTYQLMNHGDSATEAARLEQSPPPWRRMLSRALSGATCAYLLESLRKRVLRAEAHRLPQSDWERQLRRELLRIDARRVL